MGQFPSDSENGRESWQEDGAQLRARSSGGRTVSEQETEHQAQDDDGHERHESESQALPAGPRTLSRNETVLAGLRPCLEAKHVPQHSVV
ncbi:hypothetical protein AOLI_G00054280 [Acnodon oligacanthus]